MRSGKCRTSACRGPVAWGELPESNLQGFMGRTARQCEAAGGHASATVAVGGIVGGQARPE
eukprot:1184036-Prymnesium_polylepis.1